MNLNAMAGRSDVFASLIAGPMRLAHTTDALMAQQGLKRLAVQTGGRRKTGGRHG